MSIRDPGRVVNLLVVVPARNESARIATCLRGIRSSLDQAISAGAVGEVAVAVVGHRCTDDTLGRAGRVLAGLPHVLVADETSTTVGDVRARGVREALDLLPDRPGLPARPGGGSRGSTARAVWILSTDADSVVPETWITDLLVHTRGEHQAVIGMARLARPNGPGCDAPHFNPVAARAYRKIIRAGIHGRSHEHVYGANLAVRADAYAAVGAFPSVPVGEDRALVEALVRDGRPVVRPRALVVTTSARRHGRAVGGLATLLGALDRTYSTAADGD